MTQDEARRIAEAAWFDFERAECATRFGGDWVAFVADKRERETEAVAESERLRGAWPSHRIPPPRDADEARMRRVLEQEFCEVAFARKGEIVAVARRVLTLLAAGDWEPLVDDAVCYDASLPVEERRRYTRAAFAEHRDRMQAIARRWNGSDEELARDLEFTSPAPWTGMIGQVLVCFGPKPPPVDDRELYPARDCVELWWSGQVMPEANGPRFAAPQPGTPPSRWRFYGIDAAHSKVRQYAR